MKAFNLSKAIMHILISMLLLSLVACSGDSGVVSNTRIGQLIVEGSVNNLHYITKTHSGKTNAEGEFVYEPGESIQFYDGNVLIGEVEAKDEITSFALSGVTLSAE